MVGKKWKPSWCVRWKLIFDKYFPGVLDEVHEIQNFLFDFTYVMEKFVKQQWWSKEVGCSVPYIKISDQIYSSSLMLRILPCLSGFLSGFPAWGSRALIVQPLRWPISLSLVQRNLVSTEAAFTCGITTGRHARSSEVLV